MVSLFSGAGGLDLGLELAGLDATEGKEYTNNILKSKNLYFENRTKSIFHISYSNDNFKEANETYAEMFSDDVVKNDKDIRKIAHFPECQIMAGGFPCPGFSAAGPRLIDDPRNFLYVHYIRALLETQPAFFVGENVKGLLTLAKGEVFKQLLEDFSSAGYEVKAFLVNSRDYGVPQLRERVILIGTNIKKVKEKYDWEYKLPEPTNGDNLLTNPYVTLKDAIGDLPENPDDVFEGSFSSMYMSRNRKKKWNEQSFTIQASGRQAPLWPGGEPMIKVGKDKWKFQGDKNRRLSVKEISRIQTFPDWFKFTGGETAKSKNGYLDKKYKQIGNAVPVELSRKVMYPIAKFFVDHPEMTE
ncbi:DNA cytosine methyltransferase [Lactobacillus sp. PV037]|nr:DNA cytosine methyltransferase [Lactobacillus sp. PV037]